MDYMEKITELRASKAKLNAQAQALVTEGKFEDANKLADQMEGINKHSGGGAAAGREPEARRPPGWQV